MYGMLEEYMVVFVIHHGKLDLDPMRRKFLNGLGLIALCVSIVI